jgi:hypothetical protein
MSVRNVHWEKYFLFRKYIELLSPPFDIFVSIRITLQELRNKK